MIDPNDSKTIDLVARQQLSQVSAQYGDNLPYSYDRVLNECAFFMEQSAKAAIELGRRLILIKEMEGHGNFGKALEALGISGDTANRVMKTSLKLSNSATSRNLIQAAKSQSKVFELMVLDNDDLHALDEGQTVAGITLDDVDRMSVRELRAALRANREDLKAKDAVLKGKEAKITELDIINNKLSTKIAEKDQQQLLQKPDPEEEANKLRTEVAVIVSKLEATGIYTELKAAFVALMAHTEKTGIDHTPFMAGCINQILKTTQQLQSDFGLWADDYATNTPYWDTEAVQAAAEAAVSKLSFDWEESNEQTPH